MKSYKVWVSFIIVFIIWCATWTLIDTIIDEYKISNDTIIKVCIFVLIFSISFTYYSDYIGLN
jgi:hypothetical protein